MKTIIILFISTLVLISCGTTEMVNLTSIQNPSETQQMILNRNFEFSASFANPMATNELNQIANSNLLGPGNSAGRISLIGNTNYLIVRNDSVNAYLPYYGTRQVITGIGNSTNAIQFEGLAKNYESNYDAKNNRTRVSFSAENGTENYDITITIYESKNADVSVRSSQRNGISYDGTISKITE